MQGIRLDPQWIRLDSRGIRLDAQGIRPDSRGIRLDLRRLHPKRHPPARLGNPQWPAKLTYPAIWPEEGGPGDTRGPGAHRSAPRRDVGWGGVGVTRARRGRGGGVAVAVPELRGTAGVGKSVGSARTA